jgi:hypothetical protein
MLNTSAVRGGAVLTSQKAWHVSSCMLADERIQFAPESVEPDLSCPALPWQRITNLDTPSPSCGLTAISARLRATVPCDSLSSTAL